MTDAQVEAAITELQRKIDSMESTISELQSKYESLSKIVIDVESRLIEETTRGMSLQNIVCTNLNIQDGELRREISSVQNTQYISNLKKLNQTHLKEDQTYE